MYNVLSGFSPVGCTPIRIAATLGYECPLARCCHLIVFYAMMVRLVVNCYTLRMMLTTLLIYVFSCTFYFIVSNMISCLIKMAKILKVRINC
jgi:hypothetical protein